MIIDNLSVVLSFIDDIPTSSLTALGILLGIGIMELAKMVYEAEKDGDSGYEVS